MRRVPGRPGWCVHAARKRCDWQPKEGARCLGRDDIGKLEPGYRADLVVWPGEAAIVYTKDLKDNSCRAFSSTPGHFEDFIITSD